MTSRNGAAHDVNVWPSIHDGLAQRSAGDDLDPQWSRGVCARRKAADTQAARQVRGEGTDLAIGARPVGRGAEAFDVLDEDSAVPGSVEDRDAALRQDRHRHGAQALRQSGWPL